jgi:NADH:ubiquinone oxidoreductase subunit 5 (subunit L)/multisubunit Na+/H+ antiporter MnhA subunit
LELHNYLLFAVGVFVAVLTSFYMFRLFFVAFLGEAKTKEADHAHESPGVMVWPLRILAAASLIGGLIGVNDIFDRQFGVLDDAEYSAPLLQRLIEPFQHAPVAALSGLAAFALGLFAAWKLYANTKAIRCPTNSARCPARCRTAFTSTSFTKPRSSACMTSSPRSRLD